MGQVGFRSRQSQTWFTPLITFWLLWQVTENSQNVHKRNLTLHNMQTQNTFCWRCVVQMILNCVKLLLSKFWNWGLGHNLAANSGSLCHPRHSILMPLTSQNSLIGNRKLSQSPPHLQAQHRRLDWKEGSKVGNQTIQGTHTECRTCSEISHASIYFSVWTWGKGWLCKGNCIVEENYAQTE